MIDAVRPAALERLVADVCVRLGSDDEIAAVVASHLVRANLSGHDSHGVARLPDYAALVRAGELDPAARPEPLRTAPSAILLDARRGFGQFSTRRGLELAMEAAGTTGVGVVAIRHSQHIGRLGEYGEFAAQAGMIAIVTVGMAGDGVGAMVLPGTATRFFGANPWAFAIPGTQGPGMRRPGSTADGTVLVDASTAVVAEGKVRVAQSRGEQLPEGWIVDADGRPATDPEAYFAGGGLLPLGAPTAAHKGYGLGLASALLGGLAVIDDPEMTMIGASVGAGADPLGRTAGVLVVAIDPGAFGDRDRYAERVAETASAIHRSADGMIVPGEPERSARAARASGIELPDSTIAELRELARSVGADPEALG